MHRRSRSSGRHTLGRSGRARHTRSTKPVGRTGTPDAELLEAAKNYAIDCRRRKTEKEYIKHPKTFLSDSLPFLDYLPKREKPQEDPGAAKTNPFEEWGEDT